MNTITNVKELIETLKSNENSLNPFETLPMCLIYQINEMLDSFIQNGRYGILDSLRSLCSCHDTSFVPIGNDRYSTLLYESFRKFSFPVLEHKEISTSSLLESIFSDEICNGSARIEVIQDKKYLVTDAEFAKKRGFGVRINVL